MQFCKNWTFFPECGKVWNGNNKDGDKDYKILFKLTPYKSHAKRNEMGWKYIWGRLHCWPSVHEVCISDHVWLDHRVHTNMSIIPISAIVIHEWSECIRPSCPCSHAYLLYTQAIFQHACMRFIVSGNCFSSKPPKQSAHSIIGPKQLIAINFNLYYLS